MKAQPLPLGRRKVTPARKQAHHQSSAPAPLALAKLTPPSLPALVTRSRLTKQIEQARRRGSKVVWIQAPPGSGKTTLATSYLRTMKCQKLWYQLNSSDADPATWVHYLSMGIQQAAPRFRKSMPALEPAYMANLPEFIRRFFEELFMRLKSPGLLIFDNYHDLPIDSPVQGLMAEAFRTIPPGILCLVTSRLAPPPSFATFIANQTLIEFPADDLAFDLAETKQLLALHHPKNKSPEAEWTEQLHMQTQGWVAGMILLGTNRTGTQRSPVLKLKSLPHNAEYVGDHSILFDYFVQEALIHVSSDIRMLLLKTAMFPAFTDHMAQKITGLAIAGYELNKLSRARYFVENREGVQKIFQYHPLFKEFLRHQAAIEFGPDTWKVLQEEAAEILLKEGWIEDAIELHIGNQQHKQVSHLLIEQAPKLIEQGRFQTLAEWLGRIPDQEYEREPYLRYWQGMSLLLQDPTASLRCFQTAFQTFQQREDVNGMLLAASGAIYSIDFTWTHLDRIDEWLPTIDAIWEQHATDLPSTVQSTVIIAMMRGLYWRQPHRTIVQAWIERAVAFIQQCDRFSELTILLHHIVCCSRSFGSIQEVLQSTNPAIQKFDNATLSPPNQLAWEISQTGISWVTGAFQKAKVHYQRAYDLLIQHEVSVFRGPLLFNGLYAALHSQNLEHAETLVPSEADAQHIGPVFYAIGIFQKAWFYALKGEMDKALSYAQQSIVLAQQSKGRHFEAVATLGLALVLANTRRFEEVEHPLAEVEAVAQALDHVSLNYSCQLLRAYVLLETSTRQQALPFLKQACQLGRQHDIFYTYESWLPSILTPLCALALEEGIELDYVRQLIQDKYLTLDAKTANTLDWPWPIRIQTLGTFLITTYEGPVVFGRKAPLMPLRLLQLLLSLGGQTISLARLSDELWPDADGDAAYRSILTTLTRLRKILGREDALIVQGGLLSINSHLCWVDSLAFEHLANKATLAFENAKVERAKESSLLAQHVYEGLFLSANDEILDVCRKREQLQALFLKLQDLSKGG